MQKFRYLWPLHLEIMESEVKKFSWFLLNLPVFSHVKSNQNGNTESHVLVHKIKTSWMTSDTILETRRVGLQHILKLGEIKFWPGTPSPYPLMEVNHHHLKLKKSRLRDENFFHEKFLPDNFFVHRVSIQAKIGQNWRKFGLMTTTFVWRFFDIGHFIPYINSDLVWVLVHWL